MQKHFILQSYLHFWWYFSSISQHSELRHSWTLDQYQSRTLFCILSIDIAQGRQPDFNTSAQHLSFSLYFYTTVVLSTSLYFTLLELWTLYSTILVINIFIFIFHISYFIFVNNTFAPRRKLFFLKLQFIILLIKFHFSSALYSLAPTFHCHVLCTLCLYF